MYRQATDLLIADHNKATIVCDWCGRMYTARPALCACKGNVFLREHRKSDTHDPFFTWRNDET